MSASDSRIQLVRCEHAGVATASNHGFSYATAPFVARMDADDVSRPHRLEKQLNALVNNPGLSAITCLAHFAGDPKQSAGYAHHVQWTNQQVTTDKMMLNRFIDLPFPHPTLMYRSELVKKYGGYRQGNFPEDYEMILRWIAGGAKIAKINEILYDWHDPPTRLSRNDPRYDMMAFHRCKATYLKQAITHAECNKRELWIWGAGRPARKCAQPLEQVWKPASGFIDIDPRKIGLELHGHPIVSPDNLPATGQAVIVSYVGTRGARDNIRAKLIEMNRVEGIDFWIAC